MPVPLAVIMMQDYRDVTAFTGVFNLKFNIGESYDHAEVVVVVT